MQVYGSKFYLKVDCEASDVKISALIDELP